MYYKSEIKKFQFTKCIIKISKKKFYFIKMNKKQFCNEK